MSANSSHQKQLHKMCKSPPKNLHSNTSYHQSKQQQQPSPKAAAGKSLSELGSYEIPNTNCTMVGSNNLHLDSKLSASLAYQLPQIKVCAKPMKSPGDGGAAATTGSGGGGLLKKPHSPRSVQLDPYMGGGSLVQNIAKYTAATNVVTNFSQLRGLQPSPTPTMAACAPAYNKLVTFEPGAVVAGSSAAYAPHQPARVTKPGSFTSISSSPVNNGTGMCAMSPSAYSNPSPSYPSNAVSPYNVQISSPANSVSSITSGVAGIKSPVPSPQSIRPPTPQPILPQAFQQIPVMTSGPNLVQIIHAPNSAPAYQNHTMLARQTIIAPPAQSIQNAAPILKIKPPLNILPKPPSSSSAAGGAAGGGGGKQRAAQAAQAGQQLHQGGAGAATQLVLPNQAILPATQPGTLLLNQMPLIVQQNTAQGVQLILRPGTPTSAPHLAAAGKMAAAPNLILQQGAGHSAAGPQVLIQHAGAQRQTAMQQPQQLVRVLTANGMIQQLAAPTYIAMNNQQLNIQQQLSQQQQAQPQKTQIVTGTHMSAPISIQQNLINACLSGAVPPTVSQHQATIAASLAPAGLDQLPPPKKKPKKKKKHKETKLDLANLMKLSGIGDDDVESDTSESAGLAEANQQTAQKTMKTEPPQQQQVVMAAAGEPEMNFPKRIGNIHISAITQEPGAKLAATVSPSPPNSASLLPSGKPVPPNFGPSQVSVQQSLSDINAINQNLAHIGLINQNAAPNFISTSSQILSQINTAHQSVAVSQNSAAGLMNTPDNQNLASILQALNHSQHFPLLNGQSIQNISVSQAGNPGAGVPGLPTFASTNHSSLPTSTYPKFSANVLPTPQSTNATFASNLMSNIVTASSMSQSLCNVSDSALNSLPKSQPAPMFTQTAQKAQPNQPGSLVSGQTLQNLNAHFNLPNTIPNIQVQNFCGSNQNLILNQGANTIITPNIPNFSGNITINNSLIPNANLALPNNLMPNFLSTNLVQPAADVSAGFANNSIQRTGGFKLALSEDGRLILQHDPNLNQDIQSQLLLQSIFGINLQGGNLVLTSVNNAMPQPPKPVTPKPKPELSNTKTTSIIQNVIPSVKTETHQPQQMQPIAQALPQPLATPEPASTPQPNQPNNFSYIVNLTPEQLETLKRNGQLTVNGQTIFMHRPGVKEADKSLNQSVKSSPKNKNSKKKQQQQQQQQQFDNKTAKTVLQEHLNIKSQQSVNELVSNTLLGAPGTVRFANQTMQAAPAPSPQPAINSQSSQTSINSLPAKAMVMPQQPLSGPQVIVAAPPDAKLHAAPHLPPPPDTFSNAPNLICIQPNASKPAPSEPHVKVPDTQPNHLVSPHLLAQKTNILKAASPAEPLIIFQPQTGDSKPNIATEKKVLLGGAELPKSEPELLVANAPSQGAADNKPSMPSIDGKQPQQLNVEQFLSNLNINPANLGQLISQKLSQEVPGGVDHKIVNIAPGATAGHIVAKIDISPENMQQILAGGGADTAAGPTLTNELGSLAVPPLISMNVKPDSEVFGGHVPGDPVPSQQLPALIIGGNVLPGTSEPATSAATAIATDASRPANNNTVYQRIQTIQLTPQKQQLLKSVQLQIQALTARLQQKATDTPKNAGTADLKNISDGDIHATLRHLFMEQQKILATGKVIPTINPPISSLNCSMETGSTQTIPVTTASKNNSTFLTSLLQQPVVSHHQNSKVYYHHANQIIAISPTSWQQNQNILPSPVVTPSIAASQSGQIALKIKKMSPTQSAPTFLTPTKLAPAPSVERGLQVSPLPADTKLVPGGNLAGSPAALSPAKRVAKPTYSKAQLIEQQLTTDQNGAMNPDISTPFASKADACKRLVRYHCYNQPVLSQKDLNKADEIFEMTARHFIEKFRMMVNKYKYLLFKESMREVQTSELMMIDRMFLAEEQQSFLKLQSDVKLQNELEMQENVEASLQEMYKKETDADGEQQQQRRLPFDDDDIKPDTRDFIADEFIKDFREKAGEYTPRPPDTFTVKTEDCCGSKSERYDDDGNTDFNIKCGVNYFSDESCESGGNYRVYEQSPKEFDAFIGSGECFGGGEKARDKEPKKGPAMESYNTTKIIGNFEIEINNKGCSAQESYTKNFRQKIIDGNKVEGCARKLDADAFLQKGHPDTEDYDEWLCIQRELGYFPPDGGKPDGDQKAGEHQAGDAGADAKHSSKPADGDGFKKAAHKRTSSDSSRLETLKKFRVEKHNAKVKKTGSIIGEVKFEVRIEHKKVFTSEPGKKSDSLADHSKATAVKRSQCFDFPAAKMDAAADLYSAKRACMGQGFKAAEAPPPASCASCHPQIKQEEPSPGGAHAELSDTGEIFDRSIDEQVQSAIDSILNLQQISSSMPGPPSLTCGGLEPGRSADEGKQAQQQASRTGGGGGGGRGESGHSDLTHYGSKTLSDDFCETTDTLDEAVKSILS